VLSRSKQNHADDGAKKGQNGKGPIKTAMGRFARRIEINPDPARLDGDINFRFSHSGILNGHSSMAGNRNRQH
jgi:hypothetical protein